MAEVESRIEKRAAGATKLTEVDITEKTLPFTMWMKKQGYRESTITTRTRIIKSLLRKGANLYDPESVKEVVAEQKTWNENTKFNVVNTYSCFLLMCGGTWTPPRYKETRHLPFIPTELEIDQLIAGCGKKTAAFLQLLKETAIRAGEAQNLEWRDIDTVRYTINVKPEKNSAPRIFNVTTKLIGMLMALPRTDEKVFGNSTVRSRRATFCYTRKRVAEKLQNPRILQIHFHTFRHWKATTLYHKTKDLVYVKNFLGHKNVNNTMLYIQLATTIFKDVSDKYMSRVAVNAKGARALIEIGFEKVDEFDGKHIYRKRIDPTP